MPNLFTVSGYKVYFWSDEVGEPIHVHVSKGKPSAASTKIWLTEGGVYVAARRETGQMNEYTFDELQADFAGEGRKGTASFTVEVTQGMMDAFKELSGDTNPLHTDEAFAKGRGFGGAVVFGMLTASFYSRLVGLYLPGKNCLFQSIEATFNRPVYAGDVLSVTGRVTEVDERFRRRGNQRKERTA